MQFGRKPAGKPGEWYYCVKHNKVEEGPECRAQDRLGPYATRDEAAHALDRVEQRNDQWAQGDRWDGEAPEGEAPVERTHSAEEKREDWPGN